MSQLLDRIAALSAARRAELFRALSQDPRADRPTGGSARLVAYFVPKEPGGVAQNDLRSFLAERLPAAVVPTSFVELQALPRLPSGKLNRRGLPSPVAGRAHLTQPYRAPRTAAEEMICLLFSDLLGVPEAGIDDGFFELGGDSLNAIRLAARIRHQCGVDLGVGSVFEAPTAALLAARLADQRPAGGAHGGPPLTARHATRAPLSSAQLRHWLLQMMDPASPAYNVGDLLRLTGELDVIALERALAELIGRHEILRTSYPATDGEPEQEVAPAGAFSLPVADLRDLPAAAGEQVADELIALDRSRPFDLGCLPLLRVRLIRLADDCALFSIVTHHIVADDWGLRVFQAELSGLYEAARRKQPYPLSPLAVQYADYAVWERQLLSQQPAAELEYWLDQLRSAPSTSILGRPACATTGTAASYRFEVPDDLTGRLAAWCRSRSVTIFVACLAAFAAALGRQSRQDDVVVGVPFANRPLGELENLIGCFINPAALRIDLSGADSPEALVTRADRAAQAAQARQHVPFERVTEAVRLARGGSTTVASTTGPSTTGGGPLFDVVLNFVSQSAAPTLSGVRVERLDGPPTPAKYGLTLYLERTDRALLARMVSQPARISPASVASLASDFLRLLDDIASSATSPESD